MKQEEEKPQHFWVYGFNTGKIQISEKEVNFDTEFFSFGDSRPLKPQFIYKLIEHSAYEKLQKENEQLKAKLETAKEALRFYAERYHWGNGCAAIDPCDTYTCELNVLRGGKRARVALKEIEGE